MKSQTVVFTPPTNMTTPEAMEVIAQLLPESVLFHCAVSDANGHRSYTQSVNGNTHTVIFTWSDDSSLQTYKDLMVDVSPNAKSQLVAAGWDIEFTPETADI